MQSPPPLPPPLVAANQDSPQPTTTVQTGSEAGSGGECANQSGKLLNKEELLQLFSDMSRLKKGGCSVGGHVCLRDLNPLVLTCVFVLICPPPQDGVTTIGMVGYPNVGKSSTINALYEDKKVSVSATPGKTKHFQVRGWLGPESRLSSV